MWHVIAEEDMRCTECSHKIPSGTECLSQMPPEMPENVRRRKYENFCITCTECNAGTRKPGLRARPCYMRQLDHRYVHEEDTREPVPCGHCGEIIPEGTWAVAQKLYAWPDSEVETEFECRSPAHDSGIAAGIAVKPSGVGWDGLSPETQRSFQTRGLGRGLEPRSPVMAQRLYEKSIPKAVRNAGEGAVLDFIKGKDASHIRSVSNAPSQAKQPSNIILEKSNTNRARGSKNMTAAEVAATEAPIAGAENFFHWKRSRKSGEQAVKNTAKKIIVAGMVGAGLAAVGVLLGPFGILLMVFGGVALFVTRSVSMVLFPLSIGCFLGFLLGPFVIPLRVLLFVTASVSRISKAARHDLPLDEYHIFFCKNPQCKKQFARDITKVARENSQN